MTAANQQIIPDCTWRLLCDTKFGIWCAHKCSKKIQTSHHFGYNKFKSIQWTNCHSIFLKM